MDSILITVFTHTVTYIAGIGSGYLGLKRQINLSNRERLIELYEQVFDRLTSAKNHFNEGKLDFEFVFFKDFIEKANHDHLDKRVHDGIENLFKLSQVIRQSVDNAVLIKIASVVQNRQKEYSRQTEPTISSKETKSIHWTSVLHLGSINFSELQESRLVIRLENVQCSEIFERKKNSDWRALLEAIQGEIVAESPAAAAMRRVIAEWYAAYEQTVALCRKKKQEPLQFWEYFK